MMPRRLLAAVLFATTALALQAAAPPAPAAVPAPLPAATPIKGQVLEVKDVPGFTYLRMKTAEGEIWASVPTAAVKAGAQVTLYDPVLVQGFESKSLKRKFDKLVMASLNEGKPKASGVNPHATAPAMAAPVGKIPKASAADARTVAEVVGGPAALKGRSVTIRGQVVKYSAGIMGKNWVHLQDGSGSAEKKTNDILVTTSDSAAVGDVVSASGTVRTDVDFGSGYAYAVMVENAKIRK